MDAIHLTQAQARRFFLSHQRLLPPRSLEGKAGLLEFFKRVRCVQFDPIDVTGRNHELVLQARVKGFSTPMLYEALYEDRALVDTFDKNMCIYCTEDWPYFRRNREGARRYFETKSHPVVDAAGSVREEIERRGPLSSADLEMEEAVRWPWGSTRLARAVLEAMYFWGELVVHRKVGVRKIYDLAERHISRVLLEAPEPNPSFESYHDWHIHRRVGSIGLMACRGTEGWLGIEGTDSARRTDSIKRLVARGDLRQVNIEGISVPFYMRTEDEGTLGACLNPGTDAPRAAVIAPLDNLMWDRRNIRELFGFDYTWEVYVPPGKRRYGYYVLPLLYGDRFVARFEPVRDRKSKAMVIKNWWWEDGVDPAAADMRRAITTCIDAFRVFLGCEIVRLDGKTVDAGLSWLTG